MQDLKQILERNILDLITTHKYSIQKDATYHVVLIEYQHQEL